MRFLLILICFYAFNVYANWQVEVALGIDGETWKIEHAKFEDGKEQSLNFGTYLLKMSIKRTKEEKVLSVNYVIEEKKGDKKTLVAKGEDLMEDRPKNDIFAKGEKDQPHTIISLKMKPI